MTTQSYTQQLTQFRNGLYHNFDNRADTLMELIDALLAPYLPRPKQRPFWLLGVDVLHDFHLSILHHYKYSIGRENNCCRRLLGKTSSTARIRPGAPSVVIGTGVCRPRLTMSRRNSSQLEYDSLLPRAR
jgi:hypothetical protein